MPLEAIALQMTPGIGPKGAVHLLEVFGDARAVFAASAEELAVRAELHPKPARELLAKTAFAAAERELAYCRRHGIRPIASTDAAYPPLLREIPDYPAVLYVQGDPAALQQHVLAVVGTRKATPGGLEQCRRIVGGLAERIPQLTLVSGTAYGIDIAVHRAALEFGVKTAAVLANPLPAVSPVSHTSVMRQVLDRGGALVTELHSQTRQNGEQYIPRNRIIAALAAGCLVIESPAGGGSLHTAHLADGYHRTVMALPGRPTDRMAAGTNHLIRTQRAQLVCSAGEVIETLLWDFGEDPARFREQPPEMEPTGEEARLCTLLEGREPLSFEALLELAPFDAGKLEWLLFQLEMEGRIRRLPGSRYEAC